MVSRRMPIILSWAWFYRFVFSSRLSVTPPLRLWLWVHKHASCGPLPWLSLVVAGMNNEGFVTRKAAGYAYQSFFQHLNVHMGPITVWHCLQVDGTI